METFLINLSQIQPSQLYISEAKLERAHAYLDTIDLCQIDPLPIKKIGDLVFFTDGHTRAFALQERGIKDVAVYWDSNDLDWLLYLICVNWCLDADVRQIGDLKTRVISHFEYEQLWHQRCQIMQDETKQNNVEGLAVRLIENSIEKSSICEGILRSLPAWFGIEEATRNYIQGAIDTLFLAVFVGKIPVGFISLKDHNPFTSEIYVMGIYEELHRRGLGKILLQKAEAALIKQNRKFLMVKTLGDSFPDVGYKHTKQFYSCQGFFPLEESWEIWGSRIPCLIMVKPLNPEKR